MSYGENMIVISYQLALYHSVLVVVLDVGSKNCHHRDC